MYSFAFSLSHPNSTSWDADHNQLLSAQFERGRSADVDAQLYVQFYLYAVLRLAIRQPLLRSEQFHGKCNGRIVGLHIGRNLIQSVRKNSMNKFLSKIKKKSRAKSCARGRENVQFNFIWISWSAHHFSLSTFSRHLHTGWCEFIINFVFFYADIWQLCVHYIDEIRGKRREHCL